MGAQGLSKPGPEERTPGEPVGRLIRTGRPAEEWPLGDSDREGHRDAPGAVLYLDLNAGNFDGWAQGGLLTFGHFLCTLGTSYFNKKVF